LPHTSNDCSYTSDTPHPTRPALETPTETTTPTTLDTEAGQQAGPLCVEEIQVGDQWSSPWRKIAADDVALFAQLTGDNDPLHSDDGDSSPFGEPVAHGLLGLSVLAGLSTEHPRVATLALVGLADWRFEAPIFFNDSVQVVTEVESIEKHGRRAARITWLRKLVNQSGSVVQQGRFVSLVATKARLLSSDSSSQRGTLPAR